jgi:hypothetical protein
LTSPLYPLSHKERGRNSKLVLAFTPLSCGREEAEKRG